MMPSAILTHGKHRFILSSPSQLVVSRTSCRNIMVRKLDFPSMIGVTERLALRAFSSQDNGDDKKRKPPVILGKTPRSEKSRKRKNFSIKGSDQFINQIINGGIPSDPAPPPFRLANFGEESLYTLVLLRHGESEWNRLNLFTGWCDVDLTEKGEQEARAAGRLFMVEPKGYVLSYSLFVLKAESMG